MKVTQFRTAPAQGGFTLIELIELIELIVVLGILAAVALPKFADLGGDARRAAVRAAGGYPSSAATTAAAAGLRTDDWSIKVNGRDLIVSPHGAATPANCTATYSEATAVDGVITPAKVVTVDTGC